MRQVQMGNAIKHDEWIDIEDEVSDPTTLPEMPGFHVLVRPASVKNKTKGGIFIPDSTKDDMSYLTTVGRVIALGDLAYKDLEKFYNRNYIKFIDLSVDLIKYFCGVLNINTDIVYSSEICKDVDLTGMDKIFYILEQLKADTYISSDGPGSRRYIKEEDFNDKNIKLIWQNFEHPTYKQMYGDFISHLSVIDLIFNNGGEISKEVIKWVIEEEMLWL